MSKFAAKQHLSGMTRSFRQAIACIAMMALVITVFSIPVSSSVITAQAATTLDKDGHNKADVAALKKIIAEQNKLRARASEDMGSSEYTWTNGKLTGIDWDTCGLEGSINFGSLVNLTNLNCSTNKLSALDVSKNVKLTQLNCYRNQLSKLDVSKNMNLEYLDCASNKLSKLDISKNTKIAVLYCNGNQLRTLDVSKHSDISSNSLSVDPSVKLTGVKEHNKDDVTSLKKLITAQKKLSATVSEDMNNREYNWNLNTGRLIGLNWGSKNLSGTLNPRELTALMMLSCTNNKLSKLEISNNINLTMLLCYTNKLGTLDVSKNVNLKFLHCGNNQLSTLDVNKNARLLILSCPSNQLSKLDVSKNVNLANISCYSNQLSTLDVSKNVNLVQLTCYSNQLNVLDVSKNMNLESLDCSQNQLSVLDVSKNVELTHLSYDKSKVKVTGWPKK